MLPEARRLGLWPTLLALPMLAILLALGTWQLQRLGWKEQLIAERAAQYERVPVALPASVDDPAAWEYRRVVVEGEFLHDREMLLQARTLNGRPGYHVVTPLRREEGPAVLVDRGWVPHDRASPEMRAEGQEADAVRVEGIARVGARPSRWTPDNRPADDEWYWVEIPAMARQAGVEALPVYIAAVQDQQADALPAGVEPRVRLPNNHLQYALTWYALAAALAVIYVLSHRRRRGGNGEQR
jgi:surfeit locus 1 family protein